MTPSSPALAVRKEEKIREEKSAWIDKQAQGNKANNIAHDHERAQFLDETKAELEPKIRSAIPLGSHISFYGKRSFAGFPGFGPGKIAERRKISTSSSSKL